MPNCYVLIGLPGSGKSTWRAQQSAACRVISTDDLIDAFAAAEGLTYSAAFTRCDLKAFERQAFDAFDAAVAAGADIIIDRTNLSRKSRARFLARLPAAYPRHAITFAVPPEVLAERLAQRAAATGKHIPEAVIEQMRANFQPPQADEGFAVLMQVPA